MGLFGGGNRSSSATTNNYNEQTFNTDARQDNSGDNRGNFTSDSNNLSAWSYDLSNNSTNVFSSDSSNRSTNVFSSDTSNRSTNNDFFSDSSNRSVTNITGTDAGVVDLARIQAGYGTDLARGQTDAVKAVAGFGASTIDRMGDSATRLFEQSASNSAQAWGHTVDVASETLSKMFDSSTATLKAAQGMASSAMSTYQPAENKSAEIMKYAMFAGVALAAVMFFRKG